jgi:hypothetical protein
MIVPTELKFKIVEYNTNCSHRIKSICSFGIWKYLYPGRRFYSVSEDIEFFMVQTRVATWERRDH